METQRQIDNRLLEMIQRHFPSLPLDDKYTDWQRWLKFANAVRSDALEQAARELEHHCSHWEAWFLKQRAAGEMPTFDEAVTPSNAELNGGASAPSALSAVLGAVELIEETGMNKELNAAEAVYGFVGWLTTREERTVMSAKDDCAPIAELVKRFCTENNLPEVSDQWPSNLIHPSGEVAVHNAGGNSAGTALSCQSGGAKRSES